MSAQQMALLPTGRFWVVRLAQSAGGGSYGPFPTERAADEVAHAHGLITSNFVYQVRPPEEVSL